MDKIYFTITGTSYRYGTELFEKGDRVMLKKNRIINTITKQSRQRYRDWV